MKDKILALVESFKALDHQMASTSDPVKLTEMARDRKRLEPIVAACEEWLRLDAERDALVDMMAGSDASMAALAHDERKTLDERLSVLGTDLKTMLTPRNPVFEKSAIVEIRAGAGGDEAGLFVADLFRMYSRFASRKGLTLDVFTANATGVGGYKEVIFEVSGANAYGLFHFEQGVHRVQRVPKTEAQGRIHTSTVTVAVLPEASEVDVKVDMRDLRIDTFRASGAGGQHVNKTDSAIRITHIPSGLVVACQEERSQGQNKFKAMALLRTKLQEAAEEKLASERRTMRRDQIGSGDRSEKIRTYNYPQDRITDHRINVNVHNMEGFLSGDMDELIHALESAELSLLESAGDGAA